MDADNDDDYSDLLAKPKQVLTRLQQALLEGKLPPARPGDRADLIRRFEALRAIVPPLPVFQICKLSGVPQSTGKRWARNGTADQRFATGPERPAPGRPASRPAPAEAPAAETGDAEAPPSAPSGGSRSISKLLKKTDEEWERDFREVEVWADFDAVDLLKKVCCSPKVDPRLKVTAARAVAALENVKGRIPWDTIRSLDQIPPEVQHRLAGLLLHLVAWDELPEAVRAASYTRRRAYKVAGALPPDDATAERVLARAAEHRAELLAMVAPVAVAVAPPELALSLAADAGSRKKT